MRKLVTILFVINCFINILAYFDFIGGYIYSFGFSISIISLGCAISNANKKNVKIFKDKKQKYILVLLRL